MKSKITNKQLGYAGILVFIAGYVLTGSSLFAFATFAALIYVIYEEFFNQKNAVGEAASSLAFALGAWIVISLVLNTTSPINIITSCSMLPNLDRGDVIILQGVQSFATQQTTTTNFSDVTYKQFLVQNENNSMRLAVPFKGSEPAFNFSVKQCTRKTYGKTYQTPCLDSLQLNGVFSENKSNDVIVYESGTPAGLIIHRSLLKIIAPDGEFYLTKGDNNQFPDQISGIPIVKRQELRQVLLNIPFLIVVGLNEKGQVITTREQDLKIKGKVLARIPYLGYAKLFLFLQFDAPAGCETTFVNQP